MGKEIYAGDMDCGEQLYRTVKQIAREQGRKMQDIEKALGLSVGYFSRAKAARHPMNIVTATALAKMLGVELEDLITDRYQRKIRENLVREAISDACLFAGDAISREALIQMIREEPEVNEEGIEDE